MRNLSTSVYFRVQGKVQTYQQNSFEEPELQQILPRSLSPCPAYQRQNCW